MQPNLKLLLTFIQRIVLPKKIPINKDIHLFMHNDLYYIVNEIIT